MARPHRTGLVRVGDDAGSWLSGPDLDRGPTIDFELSLSPESGSAVRGDAAPVVVEVHTVGSAEAAVCTFSFPEPPPAGVTSAFVGFDGDCDGFAVNFSVAPGAAVGTSSIALQGFAQKDLAEATGRTSTATFILEVLPSLSIDVTSPTPGSTVSTGTVILEGQVTDLLGEVTSVDLEVNGDGATNLFTGAQKTVDISQSADLTSGTNTIVVGASNSGGAVLADTLSVEYIPITADTVRWDGEAGDGLWTTAANWDTNTLPTSSDHVIIPDAADTVTFQLAGQPTIRSLAVTGLLRIASTQLTIAETSTIEGAIDLINDAGVGVDPAALVVEDTLTIEGVLQCGDSAELHGTGVLVVAPGGAFDMTQCDWMSVTVQNQGTMTVDFDLLTMYESTLENETGGTLVLRGATVGCGAPCLSQIDNRGTMELSSGGLFVDVLPPIVNSGTIDIAATTTLYDLTNQGTVDTNGVVVYVTGRGTWTLGAGSSFSATVLEVEAPGQVTVQGALDVSSLVVESGASVAVTSTATVEDLNVLLLNGGDLGFDGVGDVWAGNVELNSGATLEVVGSTLNATQQFTWQEGTLTGSGATVVSKRQLPDAEAFFEIGGPGDRNLDGGQLLVLRATGQWGTGDIRAGSGSELWNEASLSGLGAGVFEIVGDYDFLGDALGGEAATFRNDGTVRKVTALGETVIRSCYIEGTNGTVDEQSGTITFVDICP